MTDQHDVSDQTDGPDKPDQRELRRLLQSADPASALPAADPTRVARLLEDTMTDQLTDESRADGTHHRSRLTWLVAAAAAVLIGGGVLFAVTQGDDEPAPTAGATDTGDTAGTGDTGDAGGTDPIRTVTELTAAGDVPSGRCMTPEAAPEVVSSQTTVVDAVVESISGSAVTLEPTEFYAGEPTDVVVVQAPGPDMQALLSAVTFEEGGRYLVAATDGQVTLCGFSAAWSEDLAAVYAEAFGR